MEHLNTDSLKARIQKLNDVQPPTTASSVLYVMSRDTRTTDNHALIAAQLHALALSLPLLVLFVVYNRRVENRAQEQIEFLLAGLADVQTELAAVDIPFILRVGTSNEWGAVCREIEPAAVYFDFSPLNGPRIQKDTFARAASYPVYVVDTHNTVPVWVASSKQEIGARTLRPKIHHHLPHFINAEIPLQKHLYRFRTMPSSNNLETVRSQMKKLYPSNGTDVSRFKSGQTAANSALKRFIDERLRSYATKRNDPLAYAQSELSPYLHYGQLSSLTVAKAVYDAVRDDSSLQEDANTLIEEMIVRKELADNFCYYNSDYLSLKGAPMWAQTTLDKHSKDPRAFLYSYEQFRDAKTHDDAWNAAQRQLRLEGKIHGYMRMYWAKKVLEWTESPTEAHSILVRLNDFYHLDGYDPNGYVGILWSIAGLHDRPWGEREVYGVVRSMVYNGLKRKFDIQSYINTFAA